MEQKVRRQHPLTKILLMAIKILTLCTPKEINSFTMQHSSFLKSILSNMYTVKSAMTYPKVLASKWKLEYQTSFAHVKYLQICKVPVILVNQVHLIPLYKKNTYQHRWVALNLSKERDQIDFGTNLCTNREYFFPQILLERNE